MSDEMLFRAAAMSHARIKDVYVEEDEVLWRCVVEAIFHQVKEPMYKSAVWHLCQNWTHPGGCSIDVAMDYSDAAMVCSELAMDTIVREDSEMWALAARAVAKWLKERQRQLPEDNKCDIRAGDEVFYAEAWALAAEHYSSAE